MRVRSSQSRHKKISWAWSFTPVRRFYSVFCFYVLNLVVYDFHSEIAWERSTHITVHYITYEAEGLTTCLLVHVIGILRIIFWVYRQLGDIPIWWLIRWERERERKHIFIFISSKGLTFLLASMYYICSTVQYRWQALQDFYLLGTNGSRTRGRRNT